MATAPDSGTSVGAPVQRREDAALLTGRDRFAGDLDVPGLLHLRFVRSSVAHARVASIDVEEARAAPGVAGVFTAEDLDVGPVFMSAVTSFIPEICKRPALASDTVRFVGEIVAVVVAESPEAAEDAQELVVVDYEPLDAVVDMERAAAGGPLVFPSFGSNVMVDIPFEAGERPASTRRVELRNPNQRMAVAPMEPNAILAVPDEATGRITVFASTQLPQQTRDLIADNLGMDHADIRVVIPAVGGSFGGKIPADVENVLVVAAARRLGRPVRFVQSRSENITSMVGRGTIVRVALEATDDGVLTSLQVELLADGGAYPGVGVGLTMTTRALSTGCYRIPHLDFAIRGVATNTVPVGAFRGAGRPEATAMLERVVERMAVELGMDPVELRRRNLIGPDEFPHRTLTDLVYDTGDYERALDAATALVGYDDLRREQARRRAAGDARLLGIGVSMYVEISAGLPMFFDDGASVAVGDDGRVRVVVGTSAHGQGHTTIYSQIVSDVLGVALDDVDVVQGDTDLVRESGGTGGSRSAQIGGSAVQLAATAVLEKARRLAAHLLEADPADVEVVAGAGLGVRGVPSSATPWSELAAAAADPARLPAGMLPGLVEAPGFHQEGGTFPFGCHIAVVEVDPETGDVELLRFVAVDDCGTVLNPLLAAGQVHGGVAAGIGQALFEEIRYDEDGNPLTTTFADYGMPSAAELPSYEIAHTITTTPKNPLGAKGLGEAGTTGATAAVHNAVVDALGHLGIHHVELPLTPERVWTAIHDAS